MGSELEVLRWSREGEMRIREARMRRESREKMRKKWKLLYPYETTSI